MKLSIIIPTYNEAETLTDLIQYLIQNSQLENRQEIIITDGGSSDETVKIAESLGVHVFKAPKGRSAQMNAGAKLATGEILYFLHADSYPPPQFDQQIIHSIELGVDAGAFHHRFDDGHPVLRFASFAANRLTLHPMGDRSLFVRREIFHQINGYDETLIIMEDTDITKRLKKACKFRVLKAPIITSSRKFKENGELRLLLIFVVIYLSWEMGVPEPRLLQLYRMLIRQNKI